MAVKGPTMKTHTNTRTVEETEKRRQHSLTFYIDDPGVKDLFTEASARDRRNKSEWFRTYILPAAIKLAKEQLARPAPEPVKILNTPARHITLFERLKADAERAIEGKTV